MGTVTSHDGVQQFYLVATTNTPTSTGWVASYSTTTKKVAWGPQNASAGGGAGVGDAILAATQTFSGANTFSGAMVTSSGVTHSGIGGINLYNGHFTLTGTSTATFTSTMTLSGARTVATAAPSDGQALVWDAANSYWEPGTVASGSGMSAGASYYVQVRDTLQTGATMYVSSASVSTRLTLGAASDLVADKLHLFGSNTVALIGYNGTTPLLPIDLGFVADSFASTSPISYFGFRPNSSGSGTNIQSQSFTFKDASGTEYFNVGTSDSNSVGGPYILGGRVLRFFDSDSSNYIGFKSSATVGTSVMFTLPAADGTSGQALTTNGAGVLSFATISAGGSSDNMGTHVATKAVDMGGFNITNIGTLGGTTAEGWTINIPTHSATTTSQTFTGASSVTINGLQFETIPNSTYTFVADIAWRSSATNSAGVKYAIIGPAGGNADWYLQGGSASASTSQGSQVGNGFGTLNQTAMGQASSQTFNVHMFGKITTGALGGTINVQIVPATFAAAGTNTIQAGCQLMAFRK